MPPDVELLDLVARDIGAAGHAQPATKGRVRKLIGDGGGDGGDAADDEGGAARLIRAQQDLLGVEMLLECLARGVHFRMLSDARVSVNRPRGDAILAPPWRIRSLHAPSRAREASPSRPR